MSGQGTMPETLTEFMDRRCREVRHSPEWREFGKMNALDFFDMLEREYYECAFDQVPPSIPIAH